MCVVAVGLSLGHGVEEVGAQKCVWAGGCPEMWHGGFPCVSCVFTRLQVLTLLSCGLLLIFLLPF